MSKQNRQYRQQTQEQKQESAVQDEVLDQQDETGTSEQTEAQAKTEQATQESQAEAQETSSESETTAEASNDSAEEAEAASDIEIPTSFAHGWAQLNKYAAEMAPNVPQTADSLRNRQMILIDALNILLRQDDQQFPKAMTAFISIVRQHRKGAFNESMLYRAFPALRITRNERQKVEALLTLLTTAADAVNPRVVKNHVNFQALGARLGNDMQRQRIESYFGV